MNNVNSKRVGSPSRPAGSSLLQRLSVMGYTVAALVAIHAVDAFSQGRGEPKPASAWTIVKGELSALQIPLGTEQNACMDTYFADGARGVLCNVDIPDLRITNPDPEHPVAAIDAKGMISAISVGQATLTVNYLGRTLTAPCTVTNPAVKGFRIHKFYPTIDEGSTETFKAVVEYEARVFKDVVRGIHWTVTDVAPVKQVAIIDETGQVKGLHSGMAEVRATWMGHTASTMLSVVTPAKASPDPVKVLGLQPTAWRRLCMARMRRIWIPRLRALPDAKVEIKDTGERRSGWRSGSIHVAVKQGAVEREISIHWYPDECDAGGPTSGWTPSGFDWQSPSIPVEHILAAAGYDCLDYIP